ncbi:hypothetical protein F3J24_19005 [Comamonas sp. Tr-654]|nr:hypothetical protein [Comamonas sp. Tr-654]
MLISGMGFALSAIAHIAALAGQIDALEMHLPKNALEIFKTAMFIGIFAVWLPAVMIAQHINNGNRLQFSWKKVLAGCPAWMRHSACAIFIYAFANFFLSVAGGMTGLRMFSGHWMIFYGTAFCIFFSSWNLPSILTPRHCPAGHEVGHGNNFCPVCGLPADHSSQDA